MGAQLAIKLTTTATTLAMKDRPSFKIGFEVVNNGTTAVDPAMGAGGCTLTVNGKTSNEWMLAIGNGARDSKWTNLKPGQTLAMAWPLGEALFPNPGDYHLVMTTHGQDFSADVKVQ